MFLELLRIFENIRENYPVRFEVGEQFKYQ